MYIMFKLFLKLVICSQNLNSILWQLYGLSDFWLKDNDLQDFAVTQQGVMFLLSKCI